MKPGQRGLHGEAAAGKRRHGAGEGAWCSASAAPQWMPPEALREPIQRPSGLQLLSCDSLRPHRGQAALERLFSWLLRTQRSPGSVLHRPTFSTSTSDFPHPLLRRASCAHKATCSRCHEIGHATGCVCRSRRRRRSSRQAAAQACLACASQQKTARLEKPCSAEAAAPAAPGQKACLKAAQQAPPQHQPDAQNTHQKAAARGQQQHALTLAQG